MNRIWENLKPIICLQLNRNNITVGELTINVYNFKPVKIYSF